MENNLKDILSHLSTEIDQETLLLYLQDRLPAEKKHELERQLLDNEFASEAVEGLRDVKNKQQLNLLVSMLNSDLKKKLDKKKKRRDRMRIKDQPWLYFSILIFVLLIVLAYFVIHRLMQN